MKYLHVRTGKSPEILDLEALGESNDTDDIRVWRADVRR